MKTPIRLTLLGLCALPLLGLQTLRADDSNTPPPGPPPGHVHGGHMLPPGFDKLNLTDAQKEQIKQIQEETRQKIDAVLTADQKAQLEKFKAERHGHEGGAPPPPPQ